MIGGSRSGASLEGDPVLARSPVTGEDQKAAENQLRFFALQM